MFLHLKPPDVKPVGPFPAGFFVQPVKYEEMVYVSALEHAPGRTR